MLKPLIALVAAVTAVGLAAAAASAAGAPSPSPRPQPKLTTPASPPVRPSGQSQEQEAPEAPEAPEPADGQGGVHGGPVARFHGDASQACNLTDVSKLAGNWTHGDYVTAVATADPTKASQAAHSACGKPAIAAGKGKAKGRH